MNTASMGVMCGGNADDTDAANTQALANANPASRMIHAREMVSSWAADPSLARPAILAAAPSVEGAVPEASEGALVEELIDTLGELLRRGDVRSENRAYNLLARLGRAV